MIQETKCSSTTMEKMAIKCWRSCNVVAIDVEGASGGLAIFWNPSEISLSSFFTTRHSITTKFQPIGSDQSSYITNIYSPRILQEKLSFLQSLSLIAPLLESWPWIIEGDFNIITSLPEKSECLNHLDQDSKRFKDSINNLGLVDWETSNGTFTWSNHPAGQHHVASYLDRFLLS